MNWQPIETYDELKEKPKFAVFYVQPKPSENIYSRYADLSEMIITERYFGHRSVTHWILLPELPKV